MFGAFNVSHQSCSLEMKYIPMEAQCSLENEVHHRKVCEIRSTKRIQMKY